MIPSDWTANIGCNQKQLKTGSESLVCLSGLNRQDRRALFCVRRHECVKKRERAVSHMNFNAAKYNHRTKSKDRRNHLDNIRDVQPLQRNAILKIKSKPMMCFYLFYFLHMVFTQTTVIIRHSRCVYNALIVFRCLLSTTSSKVLANVCAIIILSRGDYGTRGCTREKKSVFFFIFYMSSTVIKRAREARIGLSAGDGGTRYCCSSSSSSSTEDAAFMSSVC